MRTRARIAGHSIHPMLVAFPIAFYVTTVVTLIVFSATGNPFWFTAALYANTAGVVMAALAAAPGLIDLLGLERGTLTRDVGLRHAGFNILALMLFAGSAGVLWEQQDTMKVTAPIILGVLGLLSTMAAGWLGWTLVQTYHVGVHTVADEEFDVSSPSVHIPASFREEPRAPLH